MKNKIKLKTDKKTKIKKGDLVAISKTGKAKKAKNWKGDVETITRNFTDIKFDNVQKMKLKIESNKSLCNLGELTPKDIIEGSTIIKLEAICGNKFLNDFTDFIESKMILNKNNRKKLLTEKKQ